MKAPVTVEELKRIVSRYTHGDLCSGTYLKAAVELIEQEREWAKKLLKALKSNHHASDCCNPLCPTNQLIVDYEKELQ